MVTDGVDLEEIVRTVLYAIMDPLEVYASRRVYVDVPYSFVRFRAILLTRTTGNPT
jgi:hypothetical protein